MQEQQLKAAPFNLDAAAIAWVRAVFSRLSEDDKVRQLFNLRSAGDDPQMLARQQAFRAGSITRVPGRTGRRNARLSPGSMRPRRLRYWCRPISREAA